MTFASFLKALKFMWGTAVAAAAAGPLILWISGLEPPWPPGAGKIATLFSAVAVLLAYPASRALANRHESLVDKRRNRGVRSPAIIGAIFLILGLLGAISYLWAYSTFVVTDLIETPSHIKVIRIVVGSDVRRGIQANGKTNLELLQEHLYDPESVWTRDSLRWARTVLLTTFCSTFFLLTFGTAVLASLNVRASITASAISVPTVPGKSTVATAGKGVAGLSQTLKSPDQSVSRYDFFIAYATPDRRLAQALCWFLQDDACEVFLDIQDLSPGAVWPPELREALEASRAIVVLVSTHTNDAFYQQEEIVRAIQLARDKPNAHTVIPVILEKLPQSALSMPYGMSSMQAQDATRSGGLKRVATELVAWLKDH